MNKKKIISETKAIIIIIIVALSVKVTILEAYIVPTGSMENTIMTGDFLIGSRFVYCMRTPEWIGIPYTDIGFDIPSIKFPSFREPKKGDIIIFKFPRDVRQKYVKRCVAEPGDILEIKDKIIYKVVDKIPTNLEIIKHDDSEETTFILHSQTGNITSSGNISASGIIYSDVL